MDALRDVDAEPRVVVETEHRAMIVPLVLAGAGSSLLPRSMAGDAARQRAVIARIRPRVVRQGRVVWRPGPLSPAAAHFVNMVSAARE